MVFVRQTIVLDASNALSKAVCIAVRYSAVRRQFGSQNGGPETQVLDYKTQQSRLFSLLASAYAFRMVLKNSENYVVAMAICVAADCLNYLLCGMVFGEDTFALASGKQPVGTTSYLARLEHLVQCSSGVTSAWDWLNPSFVMEAFEARAARLVVGCAKNISKASNPEEGLPNSLLI